MGGGPDGGGPGGGRGGAGVADGALVLGAPPQEQLQVSAVSDPAEVASATTADWFEPEKRRPPDEVPLAATRTPAAHSRMPRRMPLLARRTPVAASGFCGSGQRRQDRPAEHGLPWAWRPTSRGGLRPGACYFRAQAVGGAANLGAPVGGGDASRRRPLRPTATRRGTCVCTNTNFLLAARPAPRSAPTTQWTEALMPLVRARPGVLVEEAAQSLGGISG
jgi:hypothetical protein